MSSATLPKETREDLYRRMVEAYYREFPDTSAHPATREEFFRGEAARPTLKQLRAWEGGLP